MIDLQSDAFTAIRDSSPRSCIFKVPHIAAGENLNLPLVGRMLRAAGAFFIRRARAPSTGSNAGSPAAKRADDDAVLYRQVLAGMHVLCCMKLHASAAQDACMVAETKAA